MNSGSTLCCVRAMLVCVSCDLPATRKVCGFQNFNARLGCSKCLKEFPTVNFGKKPNYGGFKCEKWPLRDINTLKAKALHSKNANKEAKLSNHMELSTLNL